MAVACKRLCSSEGLASQGRKQMGRGWSGWLLPQVLLHLFPVGAGEVQLSAVGEGPRTSDSSCPNLYTDKIWGPWGVPGALIIKFVYLTNRRSWIL